MNYSKYDNELGGSKMRKALNALGWIFVVLTMLASTWTLLATYLYVRQTISGYRILQICIICTMLIWAVKMATEKKDESRNITGSIFCTFIAVGTFFFMYMGVD